MTQQELVKQVKHHRDQLLYKICFDESDFNSLKRYVGKIISELESAFLTNPEKYVNLDMYIDRLKNAIEQERKEMEDKHLCRKVRRDVLSDLRKIVADNSPPSKPENKSASSKSS